MILQKNCFSDPSLWLWHKRFDENIVGDECAISIYGDIITGSDAFKCERTTDFFMQAFDLVRPWVASNCPELLPIGDNITNGHLQVMHKLETYQIIKGWLLDVPANSSMSKYFYKDHIVYHCTAPHRENMFSETIFLPDMATADLYTIAGIDSAYKGILLLYNLLIEAGLTAVPNRLTFIRSMDVLREAMLRHEMLSDKFIPKEKPVILPMKPLVLNDDIHLGPIFTKQYLRTFH